MRSRYSLLIQWSDDDQKYIVSLPEFGPYAHTHGDTYEEATQNAQEVLELLIKAYQEQNRPLPAFKEMPRMLERIQQEHHSWGKVTFYGFTARSQEIDEFLRFSILCLHRL